MKIRNILAVIRDQPVTQLVKSVPVLVDPKSHIAAHSGRPKVTYGTRPMAERAVSCLGTKNPHKAYQAYKCLHCDGFHIGSVVRG